MGQDQTRAFAGLRARKGLIDAAIVSCLLWLALIELARIAAHLV